MFYNILAVIYFDYSQMEFCETLNGVFSLRNQRDTTALDVFE